MPSWRSSAIVTPLVEPLSPRRGLPRRRRAPSVGSGRRRSSAQQIRDTIADEQGITCSVGVAADQVRRQARLGPGQARRLGRRAQRRGRLVRAAAARSGRCGGWGSAPRRQLLRLGLRTVADIAHTPVDTLRRALGESGRATCTSCLGPRPPHGDAGAPGEEHRLRRDVRLRHRRPGGDPPPTAAAWPTRTAARARAPGMMGRTVIDPVRFADFTTITRSRTLREPTDVSRDIYATARRAVRRAGAAAGPDPPRRRAARGARQDATTAPVQGLLDEPEHGWRDADRAVDRASARFGAGAVRPASLVSRRRQRGGPRQEPGPVAGDQ